MRLVLVETEGLSSIETIGPPCLTYRLVPGHTKLPDISH